MKIFSNCAECFTVAQVQLELRVRMARPGLPGQVDQLVRQVFISYLIVSNSNPYFMNCCTIHRCQWSSWPTWSYRLVIVEANSKIIIKCFKVLMEKLIVSRSTWSNWSGRFFRSNRYTCFCTL